jgi:hypothetical protein
VPEFTGPVMEFLVFAAVRPYCIVCTCLHNPAYEL